MKIEKLSFALLAAAGLLALSIPVRADDTNSTPAAPKETPPAGAPAMGAGGAGRGRGYSAEAQFDRLNQELTLTDDQKPKVKAVLDDQFKKMQDLRAANLATDEFRAKMGPIREEANAKLKDILTEDQFKKFQTLPMGGRGGPRGARGPAGGGAGTNAPASTPAPAAP